MDEKAHKALIPGNYADLETHTMQLGQAIDSGRQAIGQTAEARRQHNHGMNRKQRRQAAKQRRALAKQQRGQRPVRVTLNPNATSVLDETKPVVLDSVTPEAHEAALRERGYQLTQPGIEET